MKVAAANLLGAAKMRSTHWRARASEQSDIDSESNYSGNEDCCAQYGELIADQIPVLGEETFAESYP